MDKRKKSLKIKKDIREIKDIKNKTSKEEIIEDEEIVVTYKDKEYIFDGTESILDRFKDVIEKDKNILAIEIV